MPKFLRRYNWLIGRRSYSEAEMGILGLKELLRGLPSDTRMSVTYWPFYKSTPHSPLDIEGVIDGHFTNRPGTKARHQVYSSRDIEKHYFDITFQPEIERRKEATIQFKARRP